MFKLHRHLSAMQALNSKHSAKRYDRIIGEILRRSGYYSSLYFTPFLAQSFLFLHYILVFFCPSLSTIIAGKNGISKRGNLFLEWGSIWERRLIIPIWFCNDSPKVLWCTKPCQGTNGYCHNNHPQTFGQCLMAQFSNKIRNQNDEYTGTSI